MYNKIASVYNEFGWNDFSRKLIKDLKPFIEKWKIKSHVDLACGTGEFVAGMQRFGVNSSGLDKSRGMIKIARTNFPNLKFKVGDMTNFSLSHPVDFITCNYDSINHLLLFRQWQAVFRCVYKNLNVKGRFLFDINTLHTLRDIKDDERLKYISLPDKTLIVKLEKNKKNILKYNIEYFVKEGEAYKRHGGFILETSFLFNKIKQALLKAGFKKIKFLFANKKNHDKIDRLFILAER